VCEYNHIIIKRAKIYSTTSENSLKIIRRHVPRSWPISYRNSILMCKIHLYLVYVTVFQGKIVTIETVPLKLPRGQWKCPEVNPDQTCFVDDYLRHVLYITRIYFRYGSPESELIGRHHQSPITDHRTSNIVLLRHVYMSTVVLCQPYWDSYYTRWVSGLTTIDRFVLIFNH